ncbi:methionine synthase [Candidatus Pacearchaeota archaeon]|nr:methionine synthase [Candidatus Pacearchaeota archaeon]
MRTSKLEDLNLPLFPITQVGSFPKPDYVKSAVGRLNLESRRATEEFVRFQEEIGIDVLVDGEFYRGDMATDYARALDLPLADWTRSYDNRFWKKGIVDRPLERASEIQTEQFRYAQSLTKRPIKAMLTGPTTLADWNFDKYYKDREKLVFAWAEIVREEAEGLEKAGARIIQIDEPAIGERISEVHDGLFQEGLRRVTEGLKAYTITHVCYGDFSLFYESLKDLPIDQIDIELSNNLDLGLKKSKMLQLIKEDPLTNYRDVAVGIIDVRPPYRVESLDIIIRRIENAIEIFGQNIWVKPDCGFRTTKDIEKASEKLIVLTRGVSRAREKVLDR